MKVLSKALMSIGFASMMMGGAGMDDPSVIPFVLLFAGMGILFTGYYLDAEYVS